MKKGSKTKKVGKDVRGIERDMERRRQEGKQEGKRKGKRQSITVFLSPAVTD